MKRAMAAVFASPPIIPVLPDLWGYNGSYGVGGTFLTTWQNIIWSLSLSKPSSILHQHYHHHYQMPMRTNNGCGTFSLASWRLQSKRHQVTFYIVSLVKISETTIASTTIAQTDGHWQAFSGKCWRLRRIIWKILTPKTVKSLLLTSLERN